MISARTLLKHRPDIPAIISFHAQQCAEKMLKAYLSAQGKHIEKTHNLTRLVKLCADIDDDFSQFFDIADELSPYAVTTRYPDDWRPCSQSEAVAAVEKADRIMNFILSKLKELNIEFKGLI
ncbi:MAG: HEPN domain-containing protein [candidate division Zixibacteria bacterium]|nr:HEPN domain-containing protein [Candidatus Tariuqbacter arcticus]